MNETNGTNFEEPTALSTIASNLLTNNTSETRDIEEHTLVASNANLENATDPQETESYYEDQDNNFFYEDPDDDYYYAPEPTYELSELDELTRYQTILNAALTNISDDKLYEYGHQFDLMVKNCTWKGVDCKTG